HRGSMEESTESEHAHAADHSVWMPPRTAERKSHAPFPLCVRGNAGHACNILPKRRECAPYLHRRVRADELVRSGISRQIIAKRHRAAQRMHLFAHRRHFAAKER